MFSRSITFRLTLWYSGILVLILLLVGGITYLSISFWLFQQGYDRIQLKAHNIQKQVDGSGAHEEGNHLELTDQELLGSGEGFLLQISDRKGDVVNRSLSLSGQTLPVETRVVGPELREWRANTVMYYSVPLTVNGQLVAFLQVALPWEGNKEFLSLLRHFLVLASAGGLFLAIAGGFWVARLSLRPVGEITRTALTISRGDLSKRLKLQGPRDELFALAQAFNQMLDRLQSAFEEQKRFIADASHELRTPLAVIQGYTGLLRRWGRDDPAVVEEALAAISREADYLGRLVKNLLFLARADSGQKLGKERVIMDNLVKETVEAVKVLAGGLEVQVNVDSPIQVLGDELRLRQLVTILLDNAIKYTPSGGQVMITLSRENGWARLEISDTGEGIPEADLPHIFERFYRADKARSRQKGGSGLGLSIARWIVEAHQGRIEVKSEVGKGSSFIIWFPLA